MLLQKKPLFFLQWIVLFLLWFAFDLLMESVVFDYLEWNGTTKNDWFFVLWWVGVLGWFFYGLFRLVFDKTP